MVCILGYLMKCGKKSSGKMSKDTKRKSVLTLWKAKDKKLRNEEKKKFCKDMEDCSMVENEMKWKWRNGPTCFTCPSFF